MDEDDSDDQFDVDDRDHSPVHVADKLRGIQQCDPDISSLSIGWVWIDGAYDCGWEEAGRAVGANTNMTKLRIYRRLVPSFLRGVSTNRSLSHLHIKYCDRHEGDKDILDVLNPFFEGNENLRCLMIRGCQRDYDDAIENDIFYAGRIRSLTSTLSNCYAFSLRKVDLGCNNFSDEEAAELISRAISRLSNLEILCLDSNRIRGSGCTALARLIRKQKTKLKEIDLCNNDIDNGAVTVLTEALNENKTITAVSLGEKDYPPRRGLRMREMNPIDTEGWRTFFSFLGRRENNLMEKLNLGNTFIDDEDAIGLSNALVNATNLKSVDLSASAGITAIGWRAIILNWLQNLNSGLEVLNIRYNGLDDYNATEMAHFLASNSTLKTMEMVHSRLITPAGWQSLFAVFPNPRSSIKNLQLHHNSIDDASLAMLADRLAGSNVHTLQLLGNDSITADGWRAFSDVLRSPGSNLKELHLSVNVDDEVVTSFCNALAENTSLTELHFSQNSLLGPRAWDSLSSLLCDKSSIENTYYFSNHTLEKIEAADLRDDLRGLLRLNEFHDSAREKILAYHFPHGHSNINVFSGMELNVLPQAMEWIGRFADVETDEMTLLYQVVRSVPSLFDSTSNAKVAGQKRKFNG